MNLLEAMFWLCLTVYHEARGESPKGQKAVVKVILNRAKAKGWYISNVVNARKQFSCFNDGMSSPAVMIKNIPVYIEVAKNVEQGIREWEAGDTLGGATHYYAIKGMVDKKPPYWASSMKFITEIEGHKFLKEG